MQQQVELVAYNCNHADVQHIPPRTVIEDRESTTAAETGNSPAESFLKEKRYLNNVSEHTVSFYRQSFEAFNLQAPLTQS